jgi:subtilisin family serine protease
VGEDLIDDLDRYGAARVMVVFEVPEARGARGGPAFTRAAVQSAIRSRADAVLGRLTPGEFALRHRYKAVNALAGDIDSRGLLRLLADPSVSRVDLDVGGFGQLTQAVPLVNLDQVHTSGFTGAGITVAVLDSGIDTDHPDLSDDLVAEQCFCSDSGAGCCPGGGTTQSGAGSAEDDHGHGTNVTGIITSRGTIAPLGGAPDAEIVAIKVMDQNNAFCCTSDVVAGLDYIINNRPDVDVVNMSLGTGALFSGDCDTGSPPAFVTALATAVNTLRSSGVLSFASTGNQGSSTQMSAPACIANTIAVGAVYDSNVGFSSFPGVCSDPTTQADKPTCFTNSNDRTDVFAPGALTTSTGFTGTTSAFQGTSQASPLTAACTATLLEAQPSLTPAQIEAAIEGSSTLVTDSKNGLTFPRLDCLQALGGAPLASTGLLSGKKILLKDKAGDANLRKLVVLSKDPSVANPASSPIDTGATLTVFNPDSSETDTYTLPAGAFDGLRGWKGLGNPAGVKGYKFIDRVLDTQPCKIVLIKPGILLRAVCNGSGIGYTLNEAESAPKANDAQGSIAVKISMGGSDYCMEFPGTSGEVKKDRGTGDVGSGVGLYLAKFAPQPASCPVP